MKDIKHKEIISFFVGLLLGALITFQFIPNFYNDHGIGGHSDEYHIHSDFLFYVNDEKIDLGIEELLTSAEQQLHSHVHLHDDNGEIVHMHKEEITFAEFLDSISITLTNDCLTFNEQSYCSDEEEILELFVNYEPFNGPITSYVPMDDDAILLYYGANDQATIKNYLDEIKDDACYYSGTCPERGIAPPESCGLTCEL